MRRILVCARARPLPSAHPSPRPASAKPSEYGEAGKYIDSADKDGEEDIALSIV